ncbi:MAG: electron transfer flavoprotein subunit beta/FixA family protein [Deltaproteobacteria bacterium]|nr:electron transfer flavoprotein subunit beta/FixA family protein [Deltaproteobacteria bacterium]
MKILVCVKQVLDADGPVRIDASGKWIEEAPAARFRMNRFDEFALEEALRIREGFPGTRIDALSAGPARAAQTVRRALEMGADDGIHLFLDDERYRMPFEIASLIGAYASDRHYDLILAGVMAEDDMQGQVGPMVAEILEYPWATAVMSQKLHKTGDGPDASGTIYVERELEGGLREAFELTLPALLTIQSGINRPRYPALSHVLRARSQALITIPASRPGETDPVSFPAPRERIQSLEEPAPMKTGVILSGNPSEKAEKLRQILQERAFL